MTPTLTVVTPSYNQAAFLEQTLQSVLSQRKYVHEYFVLDGGSTDGSLDILHRYAPQLDWLISQPDGGQADAIARGFKRATGDFLYWLNSDDILLPGALQQVVAALESHPNWDALTGYHLRMDGQSRILSAHQIPAESAVAARMGIHHVAQQTCFFRRSLYQRIGPIDRSLKLTLDTELWLRMFDAGARWGHLKSYLGAFRLHDAAKTSTGSQTLGRENIELTRRYPHYFASTAKHRLGKLAYRASQLLSGRYLGSKADTRRWRGKSIQEVFPAT